MDEALSPCATSSNRRDARRAGKSMHRAVQAIERRDRPRPSSVLDIIACVTTAASNSPPPYSHHACQRSACGTTTSRHVHQPLQSAGRTALVTSSSRGLGFATPKASRHRHKLS
jgi:hypothetical protein